LATRRAPSPAPWSAAPAAFELAEGGTLLLDEIGEMPVGTQAKLLRVLEDHKLRRLGSKVETSVDVRVLAATNKVPDEAVANGELRRIFITGSTFSIFICPRCASIKMTYAS
jgi:transcriptional regulator with AAA-type ATPase domain